MRKTKNMTIKEMAKQVRRNYREALNTGYYIIKDAPEEKENLVHLKNFTYQEVEKFVKSAQENYIKKDEMKEVLKQSQRFLDHLKDIHAIHISLRK